jgi:UDP-3-O-acyl-N-acetylglucosamine deacetylase
MKLYITKQLDFGTQIYTQKYTKHYYLIKLKYTIRFWYTNIHTKIYKFLIKFSFYSYKLSCISITTYITSIDKLNQINLIKNAC